MNTVPLSDWNLTLDCGRLGCVARAEWHLSWFDDELEAGDWENSFACQQHRDEAERNGWDIGWRHRMLPACGMPGSLLRIADAGDDEDGFPITFCYHPFDIDELAGEAIETVKAAS